MLTSNHQLTIESLHFTSHPATRSTLHHPFDGRSRQQTSSIAPTPLASTRSRTCLLPCYPNPRSASQFRARAKATPQVIAILILFDSYTPRPFSTNTSSLASRPSPLSAPASPTDPSVPHPVTLTTLTVSIFQHRPLATSHSYRPS